MCIDIGIKIDVTDKINDTRASATENERRIEKNNPQENKKSICFFGRKSNNFAPLENHLRLQMFTRLLYSLEVMNFMELPPVLLNVLADIRTQKEMSSVRYYETGNKKIFKKKDVWNVFCFKQQL